MSKNKLSKLGILTSFITLLFFNLLPFGMSVEPIINSPSNEWAFFQNDLYRTGFLNASSSSSVPGITQLWQYANEAIDSSPFISDLNGDGKVEIVIGTQTGVCCISNQGSLIWFSPINSTDNFPIVADLYKLGEKEVLVSSNDGMIRCLSGTTGELMWASLCNGSGNWNDYPTVADLDADGQPEIIAISGYVTVFDNNGSMIWEMDANAGTLPAIADLNDDGKLEIILNISGQLRILSYEGDELLFYDFQSGGGPVGIPTIADISGDGSLEIILANHLGLFLFNSTYDLVWENRDFDIRKSSPAVADINNDGTLEIVVVSRSGADVHAFDKNGNLLWNSDGEVERASSSPVIADINGDGELEIILGPDLGWISCIDSEGVKLWETFIGKDPVIENCFFSRSVAISDLNDDQILDIVVTSEDYLRVFTGTAETVNSTTLQVSIISPKTMTYMKNQSGVFFELTFLLNEPVSWMGYSIDSQNTTSIFGNATLNVLSEGKHSILVYATDVAGNKVSSELVQFVIDTIPPEINVPSVKNETYSSADVALDLSVNEPVSWIGYSVDYQANVTVVGNTTLTGLSDGSHCLTAYATDFHENTGVSEEIYFSINSQQSGFPLSIVLSLAAIGIVGLGIFVYIKKYRRS